MEVTNFDRLTQNGTNKSINISLGKLLFALLISLIVLSGAAFFSGYFLGKYLSLPDSIKERELSNKNGAKIEGKLLFADQEGRYSLYYPLRWSVSKKPSGIPGAVFTTKGASIELWLTVDHPVILNEENLKALEKTNNEKLLISGQEATLTEYIYKAGDYFSVIKLPATTNTPAVVFWVKSKDSILYKEAKEIATSLKFS